MSDLNPQLEWRELAFSSRRTEYNKHIITHYPAMHGMKELFIATDLESISFVDKLLGYKQIFSRILKADSLSEIIEKIDNLP